jgi:hypothetical protein
MKIARPFAAALALAACLALASPLAALPGQCTAVCSCNKPCSTGCAFGGTVTTCGRLGLLCGTCLAAPGGATARDAFLASLASGAPSQAKTSVAAPR